LLNGACWLWHDLVVIKIVPSQADRPAANHNPPFRPSMLQVFIEEPGVKACSSLRRLSSGEALPWELQQRFFTCLDAELHNLYGPTEAAIDVTFWACQRHSDLNIVPIVPLPIHKFIC